MWPAKSLFAGRRLGALVLGLNLLLLAFDPGQDGVEHKGRQKMALLVSDRGGVHPDGEIAALAGDSLHLDIEGRLPGCDGLADDGFPLRVIVEELPNTHAVQVPWGSIQLQEVHGLLIDKDDLFFFIGHDAGYGQALQDALGKGQLRFQISDHGGHVPGQALELMDESAFQGGIEFASRLLKKLNLRNNADLSRFAYQNNLIA
jgi:hypothetical protein